MRRALLMVLPRIILLPGGLVFLWTGLAWHERPWSFWFRVLPIGFGCALILRATWRPAFGRFRLRVMMAWVAVFGLFLGLFLMATRRDGYLEKAREHRRRADVLLGTKWIWNSFPDGFSATTSGLAVPLPRESGGPLHVYRREDAELLQAWHADLAARYFRAADRPWASLPADPPPPIDERTDRSAAKSRPRGAGR